MDMVPTVRGSQGESGNFKESGKVMESQGKWRVRESQGILKVSRCKNQNLFTIIKKTYTFIVIILNQS